MKFLGSIGVDFKLLIAQIINFGLLLYILKRLLYRPILNEIEKEEKELVQLEIEKKRLEKEKQEFEFQKQQEIKKVREEVKKMIEEAQEIASFVKKNAQKQAEEIVEKITSQKKVELSLLQKEIRQKAFKEVAQEVREKIIGLIEEVLKEVEKKKLEKKYFSEFVLKIQKLLQEKSKEILQTLNVSGKEKRNSRKLKISLEYFPSFTSFQEAKIKDLFYQNLKVPVEITKKKNEKLIVGFKIEILGFLIETSLLGKIENVFQNK